MKKQEEVSSSHVSILQKIRWILWPIEGEENKKFLPMAGMIALILFNYTVVRSIKDSLIVTNAGPETITFLKVWTVIPAAFLFFFIYSKLSNYLEKTTLFYSIICFFIVFFAVFTFFLYPYKEWFHPTTSADYLESILPGGFKGVVNIYRYWTFSLFYTLSELWGSAALSFLFWQLANDVTKINEAKRFYAHFYFVANFAVFCAGYVTLYFSQVQKHLPEGADPWASTLNSLMTLVVLAGVLVLVLYYHLQKNVLSQGIYAASLIPLFLSSALMKRKDAIHFCLVMYIGQ